MIEKRMMSNRVAIGTLLVILVAAIGPAVSAQSRTERILKKEASRITGDSFKHKTKTPRGARVFAVNRPRASMLRAIDAGLAELFSRARSEGYRRRLGFSDYTIFIARPDRTRSSSGYSPDIAVAAGQYAGTDYDQGGFIYAAGMVMAYDPCAFIIAEHQRKLGRVSEVVRYEGEHLVLYHNDRRRYYKTRDHSRGGGHPIL